MLFSLRCYQSGFARIACWLRRVGVIRITRRGTVRKAVFCLNCPDVCIVFHVLLLRHNGSLCVRSVVIAFRYVKISFPFPANIY